MQEKSKENLNGEIERLYPILIDRCRALLFQSGRQKSEAEDIVHDIIMDCIEEHRIHTTIDVLERGSLPYYLSRAVWLQAKCAKKTKVFIEYDVMTDAVISEYDYNDRMNALNIMMTRENLHLIMRHLTDYDRELILLWMTPGFRYKDASEMTGIEIHTLCKDLKNAIKRLRKYVEHCNRTASDL